MTRCADARPDDVDVLLVEPASAGALDIARSILSERPDVPVVYASVYPRELVDGDLRPEAHLVKPVSRADLAAALAGCSAPR